MVLKTSSSRLSHSSLRCISFVFNFYPSLKDCSPRAKSLQIVREHFCKNFNHALSGYKLVCLVKPRLTRKEELQEAARQKVAATLAQSNVRNRVYGGQSTEGRKAGGPRRSRGTSTSKPAPVQGMELEGANTTVKPPAFAASNQQEGRYYDFFRPLVLPSRPYPPSPPSFSTPLPPCCRTIFTHPSVTLSLRSVGIFFFVKFLPCFNTYKSKF